MCTDTPVFYVHMWQYALLRNQKRHSKENIKQLYCVFQHTRLPAVNIKTPIRAFSTSQPESDRYLRFCPENIHIYCEQPSSDEWELKV